MKTKIISLILAIFITGAGKAQYTISTPITGLQYPVAFTFTPDGRYLVTLKTGTIKVYDSDGVFLNDFYNLSDSTYNDFERGLLGICIDPDYTTNKYVYAYYNHRYPLASGPQSIRVLRFTDASNVGTAPVIILNIPVSNSIPGNHVGGNIRFSNSEPDKLYLGIGELATPANSQVLSNPFGKFLRINSDGTIPSDNPFYDDGNPETGNDDRIWSWGHRNPFDFTFNPNDSLYSTDNGANAWDEVNLVQRGSNYGWRDCEGNYVYGSGSTLCQSSFPSHREPIHVFAAPLPAVTGVLFYTGTLMPELSNHLLVADNDRGIITDLTFTDGSYNIVSSASTFQDMDQLTTLMQGPEGCIYAMKGGYTTSGNISRICPSSLTIGKNKESLFSLSSQPNPFQASTRIHYTLKKPAYVNMTLYDNTGRLRAELMNEEKTEGDYFLNLDAAKWQLSEGTYFCRMQINHGEVTETIKLVIVQ